MLGSTASRDKQIKSLLIRKKENNMVRWLRLPVVVMRVMFGVGWLLAGITKVTGKAWFSKPGVFLENYLHQSLGKPNVPYFYKYFIQHFALKHVLFFNYSIPIAQVILGVMLIFGLFTFSSIIVCLFMHINFILSGNMNLLSLTLYTSAFGLLLSRELMHTLSLDWLIKLRKLRKADISPVVENAVSV